MIWTLHLPVYVTPTSQSSSVSLPVRPVFKSRVGRWIVSTLGVEPILRCLAPALILRLLKSSVFVLKHQPHRRPRMLLLLSKASNDSTKASASTFQQPLLAVLRAEKLPQGDKARVDDELAVHHNPEEPNAPSAPQPCRSR